MAKAALARIKVNYEPLPSVVGYDAARARGAAEVYSGFCARTRPMSGKDWSSRASGRAMCAAHRRLLAQAAPGAPDDRRCAAPSDPLLVEGTWRTDAQCHTSFEPHAAVARFEGDHLIVNLSTQAASHMAGRIAEHFGLPAEKVRVVAEHVGGAFGAKLGLTAETIAAVTLARAAKAPVRVVFDRHEELSVAGYRPGAEMDLSLLPSAAGALKALSSRRRPTPASA